MAPGSATRPGLVNADQRDTDDDGHGNRCDADLDQSGWVNAADAAILRTLFGAPPGR